MTRYLPFMLALASFQRIFGFQKGLLLRSFLSQRADNVIPLTPKRLLQLQNNILIRKATGLVQLSTTLFSCSSLANDSGREDDVDTSNGFTYNGARYTTDVFGDIETADEEILQIMRRKKILANDAWQANIFKDNHSGQWEGEYELLLPVVNPVTGDLSLRKFEYGKIETSMQTKETYEECPGVDITCSEEFKALFLDPTAESDKIVAPQILKKVIKSEFQPSSFRNSAGNQLVGNVYTIGNLMHEPHEPKDKVAKYYITELAVKEANQRTRVRFLYERDSSHALTKSEISEYDMSLAGFMVIRECIHGTACNYNLEVPGLGIYDPQISGEPYAQIVLPGKLSLLFPRGLKHGEKSIVTMEWVGEVMRYQADRVFSNIVDAPGPIQSLELTEITIDLAKEYPPGFTERPPFLL